MADHNDLGVKGEQLALEYLIEKGYNVLETNWQCGKNEVDIIATSDQYLVIVEVKTRSTSIFGEPQEFVTTTKQKYLVRAAQIYVERYRIQLEVRFDIISIILNESKKELNHLEYAFYPVL
jgi:putative endonuclease